MALDGEVGNSTYTELFAKELPERFFQMYIAEQQMIATAIGMQVRGWKPFAATFAAFLSRAYDFVRMAAVSRASFSVAGSHAGVSIGEDGPSQMALEDLAAFRAVHGSTVLYPSDANQAAALVPQMADRAGVVFMRTTREKTPILYQPGEDFHIGGSRVVRRTDDDAVTLIGAGITLHEALKAADSLAAEGIARTGDRPVQRQADRHRDDPDRGTRDRRHRDRRGSLAGGRHRRRGARCPRDRAAPSGGRQAGRARHARLGDTGRAAGGGRDRRGAHCHRGARAGRQRGHPEPQRAGGRLRPARDRAERTTT